MFRQWCRLEGHSIARPSLPKIAGFLFWLRRSRRLSVSSVMGYRSMLSAVFKSVLPEISTSPVFHDFLRSFQAETPTREVRPPSWDLNIVLSFFRSSSFEPLTIFFSLRDLPRKTLFFLRWLPLRGWGRFRLYYYYYYYYQLNCYPDWKSKKAIYPKVPAGKAIQ